MSYESKVLEVFIAHPSDTKTEALSAAATILQWTGLHGKSYGLQLVPRVWEIDEPSSVGVDAQQEINTHHVTRCDLLIALFKTRLGTPNARAVSNTVDELMTAVRAGKPAMLFSLPLGDIRPEPIEYQRLCEWLSTIENKSLICKPRTGDLEQEVLRQITLAVNRFFPVYGYGTTTARPEPTGPQDMAHWLTDPASKFERLAVKNAMPVLIKKMPDESPMLREAILLFAEKVGVSRSDVECTLRLLATHGHVTFESIDFVAWTPSGYDAVYPG